MYILCLGMPCCGKTTFCRKQSHHITFDFGSDWRKDKTKLEIDHLLSKFQCALGDIIENSYWSEDIIYIDTYPEYIDEKTLMNCPPIAAFFAIPMNWDRIGRRLERRGDSKSFIDKYQESFYEWKRMWNKTCKHYKTILSNTYVRRINAYMDQLFLDSIIKDVLIEKGYEDPYFPIISN